ncbi:MAG: pitrilysin family protein [Bdellovibrionota bacterium]|nr:pitrilysin family protein [Bdellovibrionota bacterium]
MPNLVEQKNLIDFQKGPIRRSLFSNGLVVIHHTAKNFSGARVNVNFLAGSIFEKEEHFGVAHLLEHLIFKESKTEKLKKIEQLGAGINAYTFKENICFEMAALSSKLPMLIPDFLELICQLDFTDDQFEKEKKVVIQELREDLDDHETLGLEMIFEKNFPAGLGHPIAGTIKSVSGLTKKEIASHFKKFFKPSRMIITIVSSYEDDGLERLIATKVSELLGDKEATPYRLKAQKNSKKLTHFQKTLSKNIESSILFYSFDGPSINSENYYDYVILDDLLFEGLSSEYFKKFREENAFVYGLGSSLNPFASTGNYIMVFNTQKKHLKPIEHGVRDVIKDIADNGIDEKRLDFSKEKLLDGWHLGLDGLDDRVELLQDNEIYQLEDYNFNTFSKKLAQVSGKTIQKLCKKLYTDPYTLLKLQPRGSSARK